MTEKFLNFHTVHKWTNSYHFRRLQKIRQCIYQYRDRTWKHLLGFLFRNLFLCWLELFEFHDRRAPRSLQKSTSSNLYLVTYSHIFVYHGKCCLFIRPITNWNVVLRCYRSSKFFAIFSSKCTMCKIIWFDEFFSRLLLIKCSAMEVFWWQFWLASLLLEASVVTLWPQVSYFSAVCLHF